MVRKENEFTMTYQRKDKMIGVLAIQNNLRVKNARQLVKSKAILLV